MLKQFLRWSFLKPIARRLIRRHGKAIVKELLERVKLPSPLEEKISQLSTGLSLRDMQTLREIQSVVELIQSPASKEVNRVLSRIIDLLG